MTLEQQVIFKTKGVKQTRSLGRKLGKFFKKGYVVLLNGDLGAGKTAFTQGIGEALKVESQVNSPTFVLMTVHEGIIPLYHADLYRLTTVTDVEDLDLIAQSSEGVLVIEWPERGIEVLPTDHVFVDFETLEIDDERSITVTVMGEKYGEIARKLEAYG
jgi:tRNA threonylcarbamoyladenosine biosynthesis protein TsaE|tara:strand:+ start:355 stop:831 length:477 start_codon:yes stop_codon:yes gene_type:complete